MCEPRKPIFTSENKSLGKFEIFETKNKARKYIISEKFGMMNMQGKRHQETIDKLMNEPVVDVEEKKERSFWGFGK